jgi:phage recombination protein Bet
MDDTKLALSATDITVLRNTKFKEFTDAEVQYAKSVCGHLQLNPLLNQIHFVKRKNYQDGSYTITVQVGIDGFRLAAERTGAYAGSDNPVFEYRDESSKYPAAVTVTVYKIVAGLRCAFTATAHWIEYYPGDGKHGHMWRKMPHGQLAKCAEALALRKGFPAELSAVRSDEEMEQADAPATESPAAESKASQLNTRPPGPTTPPATPPTKLDDIMCTIGTKFKGKRLSQIDIGDLATFVAWAESVKSKGELAADVEEFAKKAKEYLHGSGNN